MAIKTAEEYRERLKGMKPNVFVGGRLTSRAAPILAPAVNVIAFTFQAALDPRFKHLVSTASHLKP